MIYKKEILLHLVHAYQVIIILMEKKIVMFVVQNVQPVQLKTIVQNAVIIQEFPFQIVTVLKVIIQMSTTFVQNVYFLVQLVHQLLNAKLV